MFKAYLRVAVPDSAFSVTAMEKRIRGWKLLMAEVERNVFVDRAACETLARTLAENLRQGAGAARSETSIEFHPWDFQPADVGFGHIFLWHGERDRVMSVEHERLLAQALPHCRATVSPQGGHFSILIDHLEEIFLAPSRGTDVEILPEKWLSSSTEACVTWPEAATILTPGHVTVVFPALPLTRSDEASGSSMARRRGWQWLFRK